MTSESSSPLPMTSEMRKGTCGIFLGRIVILLAVSFLGTVWLMHVFPFARGRDDELVNNGGRPQQDAVLRGSSLTRGNSHTQLNASSADLSRLVAHRIEKLKSAVKHTATKAPAVISEREKYDRLHGTGSNLGNGNSGGQQGDHERLFKDYSVPNLVHFIFYTNSSRHWLSFVEMVSILSAWQKQEPEMIIIHCDREPTGEYWDTVNRDLDIIVRHHEFQTLVGEKVLQNALHIVDYAKLCILKQYGGIYMDSDVIILNNLDSLRDYHVTVGKTTQEKLSLSLVLAQSDSQFVSRLKSAYLEDYRASPLDYHTAILPYQLYMKDPEIAHVETDTIIGPDVTKRYLLYSSNDHFDTWPQWRSIHLMMTSSEARPYTANYIKTLKTRVGEVLRHIYFGSSDNLDPLLPHNYYRGKKFNTTM